MYTKKHQNVFLFASYMFLLFTSNNETALRSGMEHVKAPMCGPQLNDFKADFASNSLKTFQKYKFPDSTSKDLSINMSYINKNNFNKVLSTLANH